MLILNRGKLAKDYLGVNRIRITAPFKILIISTTIILILFSTIDIFSNILNDSLIVNNDSQLDSKENVIRIFSNYFNLILWTYIPISALFSFLFNRKCGYNYAENLVFQTFVLSLANIVAIIVFPINYYSMNLMWIVYQVAAAFYMVYAYRAFFGKKGIRSIMESGLIFLVGSFIWSILLVVFIIAIAVIVTY